MAKRVAKLTQGTESAAARGASSAEILYKAVSYDIYY